MPEFLQIVGAILLCAFMYFIWPPLVLASVGLFLLAAGWALEAPRRAKDE